MGYERYSGRDNLDVMAGATWYNSFLTRQVLKYIGSAKRVLDFGAGGGLFSRAVRRKGLDVVCVEVDRELSGNLRQAGFEVYSSPSQMDTASVDYIFSLNVLEHIEDDLGSLKELYRCLRPGGRMYLYVPTFKLLFSSMDRKVGHYRRYRMSELIALVRVAGFNVEEAYYADSLGFLFSILFRVIGNDRGELNPVVIKIYDKVFFPLSRALDLITGKIFGKNLVVVCVHPVVRESPGHV